MKTPDGRWADGTVVRLYDGRVGVIVGRSKRRWHAYRVLVDGRIGEYGHVTLAA